MDTPRGLGFVVAGIGRVVGVAEVFCMKDL